jgi:hypothetical protein
MRVIRATNNQNAVKTYSLLANDPVQVAIGNKLSLLNYIYDRKGESREVSNDQIITMPMASLSYRAVFWFAAQSLRSRMGHSRVFQNSEYTKLFLNEKVNNESYINSVSVKLLISTLIVNIIRKLIQERAEFTTKLPIYKKSTYYLAGLFYALNKIYIDDLIKYISNLLMDENITKIKNDNSIKSFINFVNDNFDLAVEEFVIFYNSYNRDKSDLDNLLKSSEFSNTFHSFVADKCKTNFDLLIKQNVYEFE